VLHQSLLFAPSWRTVVSVPAKPVTASGQFLVEIVKLRFPTKPATHSNRKPATDSDLKPAGVPI